MQDNDRGDDGAGTRPAAYQDADPAGPNRISFELPRDDDEKYEERMAPYWERMGRPKSADDYKFNDEIPEYGAVSEEDKSYRGHMSRVFHREGLTQRQVSRLEAAQAKWINGQRAGRTSKIADVRQRMEQELKKGWGTGYDAKIKAANLGLRGHAGDQDARALAGLELADGTRLATNSAFIRLMASVGESASPSVRAAGSGSPAQAEQEIKRIQREAMRAGLDPSHKHWPHEELDRLYARAYSTKPIDHSYG